MTLDLVLSLLRSYRLLAATELELQDQIARVLTAHRVDFVREYIVGAAGRIDFFLPACRAGLEVKIAGSPAEVLRQLHRYAGVAELEQLVLVTSRARHGRLPDAIGTTPLHVITPWQGAL